MADNTTRWDSAEYLKTEEDVRLYLDTWKRVLKKLEMIPLLWPMH